MKKNLKYATSLSAISALIFSGALGLSATAQEAADAEEQVFDTVIVTAQKREQALSDVSISANVIDGDGLTAAGVVRTEDIAKLASNVTINSVIAGQMPNVSIRGLSTTNTQFSNSVNPVALNIDGVYLTSGILAAFPLFDLERVEVLKGPQTALYGRNATAGVVNFVSRRPEAGGGGYLDLSYESFETFRGEGAVNVAVSDNVNARFSMLYEYGDGYLENRTTGDDTGGPNVWAGRASIDADFDNGWELYANVHGLIDRSEPRLLTQAGLVGPGCDTVGRGELPPVACTDDFGYTDTVRDPHEGEWNLDQRRDTQIGGALLELSKDFSGVNFTSVTAADVGSREAADDQDASPLNTVDLLFDEDIYQWSQEFRLSSLTDEQYYWIVGVNVSDAKLEGARAAPQVFGLFDLEYYSELDTFSAGIFGQFEYQLTDKLRFLGSARLNYEEVESFLDNAFVDSTDGSIISARCEPDNCSGSETFVEPAGKVALEYRPESGGLYYASYTRGFKSGGFPGGITTTPEAYLIYDPEFVDAFEVGTKLRSASGRLGFDAAVFYYLYEDLQESTLVTGAVPGSVVQAFSNAGEAEVYGLDLDLTYAVGGFNFQALLGLLETEYTDFVLPEGSGATSLDLTGNELAVAPGVNFTGVVSYEFELGNFSVTPRLDVRYQSEQWWSPENTNVLAEDAYTVADARLDVAPVSGSDWRVSAFVRNLTDEEYRINAGISPVNSLQQNYAPPRIWGVSLGLQF